MILSRLIRWMTGEPVSHFAMVFDDKLVVHSNLFGVHLEWYKSFKSHHEIVLRLNKDMSLEEEESIYQSILDAYDGYGYDFSGLLFFGYRLILKMFLGTPMPIKNEWGSDRKFLCTELFVKLPPSIIGEGNFSGGMITPYYIFKIVSDSKMGWTP